MLRAQRLEGMKAGKDLQGGNRPDDRVYAAFVEPLEKQLREGKQLLLQDLKPPADTKREEDILDRDVKIKRCLIAPDSAVGKVEGMNCSTMSITERWQMETPFGSPVEPEVKITYNRSVSLRCFHGAAADGIGASARSAC